MGCKGWLKSWVFFIICACGWVCKFFFCKTCTDVLSSTLHTQFVFFSFAGFAEKSHSHFFLYIFRNVKSSQFTKFCAHFNQERCLICFVFISRYKTYAPLLASTALKCGEQPISNFTKMVVMRLNCPICK